MSTFFIPGTGEDRQLAERVYCDLRAALELELGTRPNARRIAKLWTRRGGTDCITEVGVPDPLCGGTVLAIFDMGAQRPFVVWWRPSDGASTAEREILGHHAYSVVISARELQQRVRCRAAERRLSEVRSRLTPDVRP